jgi:predicted CoA-binding protein
MPTVDNLIDDFMAQKRIAVAGVSRKKTAAANAIYNKLKGSGYKVFAINPNVQNIQGEPCYADVGSLPEPVDGLVIATSPANAEKLVKQCIEHGVPRVWMHCSLGTHPRGSIKMGHAITSVSEEAVRLCRENNIKVIPGACPMMFCKPVDMAHRMMRGILRLFGGFKDWA